MRKSEMPLFIQAMYGTILSVSFYRIVLPTSGDMQFALSFPEILKLLESVALFKLLLFGFTLLIASHDWFSYHREKSIDKDENKFWEYLPQIFGLFFMSQMFVSVEFLKLNYWFAFGFWYTVCNVIHLIIHKKSSDESVAVRKFKWRKYIVHLLVSIAGYLIFNYHILENRYLVFLCVIAIVVICWIKTEKIYKKDITAASTTTEKIDTETAITNAEILAQTERINAWKLFANPVEAQNQKLKKIEAEIELAQNMAKEERKKIKKQLTVEKEKNIKLEGEISGLKKAAKK